MSGAGVGANVRCCSEISHDQDEIRDDTSKEVTPCIAVIKRNGVSGGSEKMCEGLACILAGQALGTV